MNRPVMNSESFDARNETTPAIASGLPIVPRAAWLVICTAVSNWIGYLGVD